MLFVPVSSEVFVSPFPVPHFFHSVHFNAECAEVFHHFTVDPVKPAVMQRKIPGRIGEMHRINPIQLSIHKSAKEHFVIVFRYHMLAVYKISQRCYDLSIIQRQVGCFYIFPGVIIHQFKWIGQREAQDFDLVIQIVETRINKFRQYKFNGRFPEKRGTVVQLGLILFAEN